MIRCIGIVRFFIPGFGSIAPTDDVDVDVTVNCVFGFVLKLSSLEDYRKQLKQQ